MRKVTWRGLRAALKVLTLGLAAALGVFMAAGCSRQGPPGGEGAGGADTGQAAGSGLLYDRVAGLDGRTVGIMTGSIFDRMLEEALPGAKPEYFNTYQDMAEATASGKIDGFIVDEPVGRIMAQEVPEIGYISEYMARDSYAYMVNKSNTKLESEISALLKEFKEDGTILEADERWFGADESQKVLPDVELTGENGTLVMAVDSTIVPFTYVKDGQVVGYDIDLLMRMCERLGYGLEIESMSFAAIIPGISSGKYDIAAGCITVTEERKQSVLFTEANYSGGVVMMVKRAGEAAASGGFFRNMGESFEKTFVREDRWKLILNGLGVTCLISVLAAAAGSVLGFGVCMMRMAKRKWVSAIARVFVRVIQGTPLVVILMILYYVVFSGRFSLNSVAVAVIGFAINFGAYVSEMMRTGIEAVDKGQIEASQAMGYGRKQTFMKITFPQAAAHFLPVLKGEFISMVKMTSVVGYIAIQDLTKVSDIIRSRTYEAFFPLIATAVIYFLLSWILSGCLGYVEKRVDPKQRKREIKGVQTK